MKKRGRKFLSSFFRSLDRYSERCPRNEEGHLFSAQPDNLPAFALENLEELIKGMTVTLRAGDVSFSLIQSVI